MQPIYKAIACKEVGGKKLLLPGYPIGSGVRELNPGDRIKVQLHDGSCLETTVQGTCPCLFDEVLMKKLSLRVQSGLYTAIEVPSNFLPAGLMYGADIYLLDSTAA